MPQSIPSTPPRDSTRSRLLVSVDTHGSTGTEVSPSKQSRRSKLMIQLSNLTREKTAVLFFNASVVVATSLCFIFLFTSSSTLFSGLNDSILDNSKIDNNALARHATMMTASSSHTQQIRTAQLAVAACQHPTKKFEIMPQDEVKKLLPSDKENITFTKILHDLFTHLLD